MFDNDDMSVTDRYWRYGSLKSARKDREWLFYERIPATVPKSLIVGRKVTCKYAKT